MEIYYIVQLNLQNTCIMDSTDKRMSAILIKNDFHKKDYVQKIFIRFLAQQLVFIRTGLY